MSDWRSRYTTVLCLSLTGYAFMGKGFASLGVAPLFVGEAMLGVGMLALLTAGGYVQMVATAPGLLLAVLLAWIVARIVPGFRSFGVMALRDAVIVGYGLFALVTVALLAERPERLGLVVRLYGRFATLYGVWATPIFTVAAIVWARFPGLPVAQLISVRPGEIAVHLTGVTMFTLAGFRRATPLWSMMVVLGVVLISPSRGAMLAFIVPVAAGILLTRRLMGMLPWLLGGAVLFAATYALDFDVPIEGGRSMGPRQMVDNVISLFGNSDAANLDGTKTWRLNWWQAIQNYTVHGPFFWNGKGFGQSLAELDGFIVGEELGGPLLRSPHNGHLTILARTGVPGLALWLLTNLSWFAMLLHAAWTARERGQPRWAGLFIWIACYAAAILIDASFDVALEGPMLGIWFWCLFGLGLGAAMIYRASVRADAASQIRARMAQSCRAQGRVSPGGAAVLLALLGLLPSVPVLAASPSISSLPLKPPACPAGAVDIAPGQSIQAAVDDAPPLARFCILPGLHRLQSVVPKAGQQFFGRPGTVLNGAAVVSDFEAEQNQWVAKVADPVGIEYGVCVRDRAICGKPAGLFVDGQRLKRVASPDGLAADQFFFDPDNGRLMLAADPAGHLVEWATTRLAFSGPGKDVVLQNLVIEKYANPAQSGAVWPGGTGWQLLQLEARDNNGVGLVGSSGGLIGDCNVHHNGQLGIGAGGAIDLLISGNEVWANNTNGFDDQWEAGGIKVAQSRRIVFRNNHVHGNNGPGIWCDEECRDVLIEGNLVTGNMSAGIFYEISSDAVIRGNVLSNNGAAGSTWFWGAEIQIAASHRVVVTENNITVRPGGKSIMLIDQNRARAAGGMYETRDNRVSSNRTEFLGDGLVGGGSDAAPGAANHGIIQRGGNRFDRGAYIVRSGAAIGFVWGGEPIGLDAFRKAGQERHGTLSGAEGRPKRIK